MSTYYTISQDINNTQNNMHIIFSLYIRTKNNNRIRLYSPSEKKSYIALILFLKNQSASIFFYLKINKWSIIDQFKRKII